MKHIFIAMAIALALASCDNDIDGPVVLDEPVATEVTAYIGTVSRASGTTWDANDEIGISGISGDVTYNNAEYKITDASSGNFTAVGSGIFYQTTEAVTFTAYYPFTGDDGITQASITSPTRADNQTADNQPSIDYLWSQAQGKFNKPVNFVFDHKMSRLSFTFTNGDDINVSDMTSYSIDGLKMEGTFNTATGVAMASGVAETLTISNPSLTSLILYPQSGIDNIKVSVVIDSQSYTCSLGTITELESGTEYTINLKISKTGLTISSCTINPWSDGGTSSGEAIMPK